MESQASVELSDWVRQVVDWLPDDVSLPGAITGLNLTLNRRRLAEFLERFSSDSDLQDFLRLDVLAVGIDAQISSTGEIEEVPDLSIRPFRLWEYIWLYKALGLASGKKSVLDLGGPASHIVMAAAFAGNQVFSVDLNPQIVEAGRTCARTFQLGNFQAEVGDMRDLASVASGSMDRIVCCSVLEHLTASDQEKALTEMARVLAPGGIIGLTFDYGIGAPGANPYLPPPHEPPETADEVRRRYARGGLDILGEFGIEDPIPGSLFRTREVSYTIAALFLGKPPLQHPPIPAVVQREDSIIPFVCIPDLLVRLSEKARRDVSRVEGLKAYKTAAEERLTALEDADTELKRLYAEVTRLQSKL